MECRKERRVGRNVEEEGVTRRLERRGGRSNEESKKNENEKVVSGRIVGHLGLANFVTFHR